MFEVRVRESKELTKRAVSLVGEIGEWEVYISFKESRNPEVRIYPRNSDKLRMPMVDFYPKSISGLELLADSVSDVIRGIAAQLRDAGLEDDLRPAYERAHDALVESITASVHNPRVKNLDKAQRKAARLADGIKAQGESWEKLFAIGNEGEDE